MADIEPKEERGFEPAATFPIVNALRSQSINDQSAHANKDEV